MKYRKADYIVPYTTDKDRIYYLLLKRKLHWKGWEFPKGGIGKKEKEINSVKRELFEETGKRALKIKNFNISGKYKYHKLLKDRPEVIGQKYKLFSAQIKKERIKLDKIEHSNYKWLNFYEALKKLHWSNQKTCLKIVNEKLRKDL